MNQEPNISPIDPIVKSVDDALSEFELHALLSKTNPDSAGYKKLARLYAVSAILQKEFPSQINMGFSSSVMSAIEHDEVTMKSKSWMHYAKQVATVSVAASVAVVSLLVYQGSLDQAVDGGTQEATMALESDRMPPRNTSVVPSFPVDFSAVHGGEDLHQSSSSLEIEKEQEDLIVIPKAERYRK